MQRVRYLYTNKKRLKESNKNLLPYNRTYLCLLNVLNAYLLSEDENDIPRCKIIQNFDLNI